MNTTINMKARRIGQTTDLVLHLDRYIREYGSVFVTSPQNSEYVDRLCRMLLDNHNLVCEYKETYVTPNMTPIWSSDLEPAIRGYDQPDKRFMGYKITSK